MSADDLLAAIERGPERHSYPRCATCIALQKLSPEAAAKVEDDVIRNPAWTDRETRDLLLTHGAWSEDGPSHKSISGHRQNGHRINGG